MRRLTCASTAILLLAACSSGNDSSASSDSATTSTLPATTTVETTTTVAATVPPQLFDDRPFDVFVPSGYEAATATPLVILLHGYGASGALQEIYFNLQPQAEERGFLYVHPDATPNRLGLSAWNATDACCSDSEVEDTAYLNFIIDEVSATYNVDATRVFLVGHSNGGFMSYRMACDSADRIAAIVSLAGATFLDAAACAPSEPVNILQIHGTDDETIHFQGGSTPLGAYPAAVDTVATWSTYNGCAPVSESLGAIDLDGLLDGDETTMNVFSDCPIDGTVELWMMTDGTHIPALSANFAADIVDWLYAHPNA
jgi:polyhydroxybutyrate depolymerase